MSPAARGVLAVEDNSDDLFLLKRAFEKAEFGSQFQVVRDGLEATEYLRGKGAFADHDRYPPPAVILLDLKMPRLSGFELLEWMRERKAVSRIPVLVLSASSSESDIRRAYDLGAVSCHVKPTAFGDLVLLAREIKAGLGSLSRGESAFTDPLPRSCPRSEEWSGSGERGIPVKKHGVAMTARSGRSFGDGSFHRKCRRPWPLYSDKLKPMKSPPRRRRTQGSGDDLRVGVEQGRRR